MQAGRTGGFHQARLAVASDDDHVGGVERPRLNSLDRLSVARDPEKCAPEKLGPPLLRSVDL